jgi:hypothetical protein
MWWGLEIRPILTKKLVRTGSAIKKIQKVEFAAIFVQQVWFWTVFRLLQTFHHIFFSWVSWVLELILRDDFHSNPDQPKHKKIQHFHDQPKQPISNKPSFPIQNYYKFFSYFSFVLFLLKNVKSVIY